MIVQYDIEQPAGVVDRSFLDLRMLGFSSIPMYTSGKLTLPEAVRILIK